MLPFSDEINNWFGFDRDDVRAVYCRIKTADEYPAFCPDRFTFVHILGKALEYYRPTHSCTIEQLKDYIKTPKNINLQSYVTYAVAYGVIVKNGDVISSTEAYRKHMRWWE